MVGLAQTSMMDEEAEEVDRLVDPRVLARPDIFRRQSRYGPAHGPWVEAKRAAESGCQRIAEVGPRTEREARDAGTVRAESSNQSGEKKHAPSFVWILNDFATSRRSFSTMHRGGPSTVARVFETFGPYYLQVSFDHCVAFERPNFNWPPSVFRGPIQVMPTLKWLPCSLAGSWIPRVGAGSLTK